ncbi:hypothetical protein LINPERHAP1_LOCUS16890 [Linum perenne]
MLIPV